MISFLTRRRKKGTFLSVQSPSIIEISTDILTDAKKLAEEDGRDENTEADAELAKAGVVAGVKSTQYLGDDTNPSYKPGMAPFGMTRREEEGTFPSL
jgi:hypothetical protein